MSLIPTQRLSPIGLDIGTRTIKLAQLALDSKRSHVTALAEFELRPSFDSPEERTQAVRAGLSDVFRHNRFRGRNVIVSLNAQQLFVQNVRLPRLPAEELDKVVRWEAEERLPEGFGDAEVRYLEAGEIRSSPGAADGSEARQEVILLACRRQELHELIAVLDALRLRPLAVDIPPCALVRSSQVQMRRKSDEQAGLLYLDVGAGATTAVVTRGQEILLIKLLPNCGQSMDRVVARKLNLSLEDAAVARRQWASGEADPLSVNLAGAVGEAVRSEIETLAGEILMCIRYHNVTFRGNRIAKVLLYGGEADANLAKQLASRLDIPCELADPFGGLELAESTDQLLNSSRRGQWAVALGLCSKPVGVQAA